MKRMTLVGALVGAVLGAQAVARASDERSQADKDFALGEVVGHCLVVQCRVFRGTVLTQSAKSGEPVTIRADEWLFGPQVESETVTVPFDAEFRKGDSLGGVARAWMNTRVSEYAQVTVVLGMESGLGVKPGEPVLVTSNERDAGIIRSVTQEALLLKRSPDLVYDAVASLSHTPNPGLSGYLLSYLALSNGLTQRGQPWELLFQMFGNPGVPAERWGDFPFWLVLYSGSVGPERSLAMIQRFVELGQQEDVHAAFAGLKGLALVASRGGFIEGQLPAAASGKLRSRYRALVEKKLMSRQEPLEAALGLKLE
jgi:hypothetical protein